MEDPDQMVPERMGLDHVRGERGDSAVFDHPLLSANEVATIKPTRRGAPSLGGQPYVAIIIWLSI